MEEERKEIKAPEAGAIQVRPTSKAKNKKWARVEYTSAWGGRKVTKYFAVEDLPDGPPSKWTDPQWRYMREEVLRNQASDAHPVHVVLRPRKIPPDVEYHYGKC